MGIILICFLIGFTITPKKQANEVKSELRTRFESATPEDKFHLIQSLLSLIKREVTTYDYHKFMGLAKITVNIENLLDSIYVVELSARQRKTYDQFRQVNFDFNYYIHRLIDQLGDSRKSELRFKEMA